MEKTNKKILIVEDDKSFLWILKQSFTEEGFMVSFATDGQRGLDAAEREKPDLIILDILMPKVDGITLARELRKKGISSPIIFLTNLKDTEHIGEAVELGEGTDYVVKSDIHIDQIIEMVKKKLGAK
ncbi:MAG: hypothetical protein A2358_03950 [Candidatus Staskawiczbacteria bacterium RIFOXYB1_FULL_37_44]|uniref:Response regulatory domain-containing protein n=1 Tax=Candidatus Staskawiczbacteria bacterium RIFOXYB1_FULL_37_44 TaxID=1802223 RepID=A0A1G2IW85_9BACT|nr:MAG: hypothetical protein A2358_03950 [Candidatus Staskawiczbacteria bacterium RIFOXYB1_FULL_37_44]OGZ83785.1 MAG: hypothetical protein A2416_00185 [Candidatus Staskawiczbacteria bacterium RIFOXYC1_FULL_37_52]OGZ88934.1 MAG: hypothetical protein A2581_01675 [Candidatus Staskawiczbacteria bacterium RIFOXYD1_FULL_37_110]OGZ89577.1 MAG: hypothetical protein A2444_01420 [Candidatus Staskawiczbacteria bacterium RIFOXYC2_FULL_37_19]